MWDTNILNTSTKHVGPEHIKAVSFEKKIEIKTKKGLAGIKIQKPAIFLFYMFLG